MIYVVNKLEGGTPLLTNPPHAKRHSQKKCSFSFGFFHKGRGSGFQSNPKVLGHFLCTNNYGILVRKGGWVDQIQKFWGTFFQNTWWLRTQKFPNSWGGGGSDLFRKKPKLKLHFFENVPNPQLYIILYFEQRMQYEGVTFCTSSSFLASASETLVC